ncbi:MAG: hypothetical protein L0Z50_35350 [Verrucomicrobiales bacterium]|nr:hypothetical protein [Verrucomicrobiales bacterium]
MKPILQFTLLFLMSTRMLAADSKPNEDVAAAAKKLGEQTNYSWKTTVVVPESAPFKPGPTEGKTEKDGFTYVTMSFGDNLTEAVKKGEKAAITDMEGNWKLASELENEEGPGRFLSMMVKNIKTPAVQVSELVGAAKDLKKEGDAYSAQMTEDGVKKQFRFGEPKNPKGSLKIWIKDGMVTKFETKVEARMEFNGNEFDASRTTTTEIHKIGDTKVNAPADAKKKLI